MTSPTLLSLLGFAAWTLALVSMVVVYRTLVVLAGRKEANAWPRGEKRDEPGWVTRASHAHLNCLETLPVFAAVVIVAVAMSGLRAIDPLAPWILAARVCQSLAHLAGTGPWHVKIRFTFFLAQIVLLIWAMVILALG